MSLHGSRVTVITVSDRCAAGEAQDRSGPILVEALVALGADVRSVLVPDGIVPVREALLAAAAESDAVVTTGGTGISSRDVTPEATAPLIETPLPGIPETIRAADAHVPGAALSRGLAGLTAERVLIVNLPGSASAARTGARVLARVLPHALGQLRGADHPPQEDTP
ncbi:MogA/MoaB family molybdenum cofactor biosynthesis protein [Demequina capsici]|uniref:MogA/MoaB family molybdenum cofactor biosynthesis protein n=1 Tax=Demequina capsici TaxID=3075620 RepID=A0AA96F9V8_9MICO|nr:MogA/MoaB family molybdenum cofactor biosynthesis protein [Demequina sp. OYTSA14]WNM25457.1 MogA/MoaB family molybdenum cofactor biosynthesis protein [Demequina sp. OYTSA14]